MTQTIVTDDPVIPPAETKPKTPFEIIENLTKATVAVLAVSYGLGLIVSNQYLAPLGVSDFSSLKPKYVITGLWTLLLFVLGSLSVSFRLMPGKNSLVERYSLSIPLGLVMSLLCIAAFLLIVLGYDFKKASWRDIAGIFEYLVLGGCSTAFYAGQLWRGNKRRPVLFDWFMLIVSLCFTLVPATKGIAVNLYRTVPEALGGGEPVPACVMLKSDRGAAFWKQAGITMKPEDDELHLLDERTKLVLIVYQDEKNMLVEGTDENAPKEYAGKTVFISKDLVEGYTTDPLKHLCGFLPPPKSTPTPSPTSASSPAPKASPSH